MLKNIDNTVANITKNANKRLKVWP